MYINALDVSDQSSVPVEVRVSEGGSTTLECQTSGSPLPQVIWTKDGKELLNVDKVVTRFDRKGGNKYTILLDIKVYKIFLLLL